MNVAVPSAFRLILDRTLEFAFPWQCVVCGCRQPSIRRDMFCGECSSTLVEVIDNQCKICAAEVGPFVDTTKGCVHCRNHTMRFDSFRCLGMYDDAMRKAILSSKWSHSAAGMKALGRLLAEQQKESLSSISFDAIVPIPQPLTTRISRSFNSATVIADELGKATNTKVDIHLLCRTRKTRPQKRVAVNRRFENQRGSFRVQNLKSFEGKALLLVDDVMTTGATCSEAARMLKVNGARQVHVAVVARVLDKA